VHIKMHKNIVQ